MNPNDFVSQMLATVTASNKGLQGAQTQLGQVSDQLGQSNARIQATGQAAVAAAEANAREKAATEYARNVVAERAQAQLGLNPDELENEIARSIAQVNAAQAVQQQTMAELQQLNSVDFVSNPISYIVNQFKASDVARRHNMAADAIDAGYGNIAARTSALNQIKSSVAANTADQIKAQQLEDARINSMLSSIKFEEANQAVISKQAGLWMQQVDLEQRQFGNVKDVLRMQFDVTNAAEMRAERAANRALLAEQRAELRTNKKIREEALADQQARLAAVSDFIGRPGQFTLDTLKQIKDKKLTDSVIRAADTLTMGDTLVDGVTFVATTGNPELIKSTNPGVYDLVKGVATSVKSRKDQIAGKVDPKTGKAPKTEDAFREAGDTYQAEIENSVANPKAAKPVNHAAWDTEFNPYKARYVELLDLAKSGRVPALQNNVVTKAADTLTATKSADNIKFTGEDETKLFKAIAEQVKMKTLTAEQAARQVKQFYDTAAEHTAQLYQYDRFNLPKPTDYYVQVPMPALSFVPGTSGTQPLAVNLRSVASIERALAQYEVGTSKFATPENVFRTIREPIADLLRGYELPK